MRFSQLGTVVCSIFMHLVNVVRVSAAVIISVAAHIAFGHAGDEEFDGARFF